MVVLAAATAADAARFKIGYDGTDSLSWTVGTPRTCGRAGTGLQTVEFRDAHPITARIAIASYSSGGRGIVFGPGHGGVTFRGTGTERRTDNTTGFFVDDQGNCVAIPPKDCGARPLEGFEPYVFGEKGGRFSLQGFYFGPSDPDHQPFENCIALQTPVATEDPHSGAVFPYTGWEFGDMILSSQSYDSPAMTTGSLSPDALRVGRTYHFRANKVFRLRDTDHFVIDSNGGLGPPGSYQVSSPGGRLGGDRSIVDTVSWEITLKRIS